MKINDIKKRIRQAQMDAAEAMFEQNPCRFIEKWVDKYDHKDCQKVSRNRANTHK